jgi:hypothetical protein
MNPNAPANQGRVRNPARTWQPGHSAERSFICASASQVHQNAAILPPDSPFGVGIARINGYGAFELTSGRKPVLLESKTIQVGEFE